MMAGRNRIAGMIVVALFALSLMAACSSRAQQETGAGETSAPVLPETPSPSASAAAPPAVFAVKPAEDAGNASHKPDPLEPLTADSQTPDARTADGDGDAGDDGPLTDQPLDAGNPSLNGISLGTSQQEVARRFGAPANRYTLPDDGRIVEMNEYGGFTVGFSNGKTVYVEIYSSEVPTGIRGLAVGGTAEEAARSLGVIADPFSNVLVARVEGGMLKVDLDPETHLVISVRLLGES
jgi:hypothetical protein